MTEFLHFLQMGGYAGYVWSSYGMVFFVLALNLIIPWRRHRKNKRQLLRQFQRD